MFNENTQHTFIEISAYIVFSTVFIRKCLFLINCHFIGHFHFIDNSQISNTIISIIFDVGIHFICFFLHNCFFSVFISTNKNCFCDSPCFYWILHYIFASASSKPISFMINFNIYLHIFLIHVHFFPYRFTRFVVNLMWILDILHKCNWFQTLRNAKKSTSFIAIAQLHLHNFLFMFFCIKIQILWSKQKSFIFLYLFFYFVAFVFHNRK